MQNELKITEDALLPIYDKLGEIEDQIKDQKGKIQTAKAQIIKNDSVIRDLLMSVVTVKWLIQLCLIKITNLLNLLDPSLN